MQFKTLLRFYIYKFLICYSYSYLQKFDLKSLLNIYFKALKNFDFEQDRFMTFS